MREPDFYDEVTGEPLWLHLLGEPIPPGGLRIMGTMISTEEVQPMPMQPATSTGLVYYWFPGEVFFAVNGQSGSAVGEALMQGRLVNGTQFQPDLGTIRRIDIVVSTPT